MLRASELDLAMKVGTEVTIVLDSIGDGIEDNGVSSFSFPLTILMFVDVSSRKVGGVTGICSVTLHLLGLEVLLLDAGGSHLVE